MFKRAKDINNAFHHVRSFTIAVVAACGLICCFAIYKSFSIVSQTQQKVYILAGGKAMEAFAANRKDNIPVEAKDHIKTFHHHFFTLDPDQKAIEQNISKALYLADGSAKRVYDDLKENGYFSGIISGNVNQTIDVDSVWVDINDYPYRFECFAKQSIVRPTTVTTRSLITKGFLRNVSRSDNNPHGFLIEKWSTEQNADLKTENRK